MNNGIDLTRAKYPDSVWNKEAKELKQKEMLDKLKTEVYREMVEKARMQINRELYNEMKDMREKGEIDYEFETNSEDVYKDILLFDDPTLRDYLILVLIDVGHSDPGEEEQIKEYEKDYYPRNFIKEAFLNDDMKELAESGGPLWCFG